ncbi:hypothetical protein TNCV_4719561 [Trichonephila clavipes]|uniref:Uncharacterized protein n=1 Tax=Trichonephila clavipes TaxID=2585209 RepID=A0A8X6W5T0_TRICX|nr:hypothetical protein TNCV_4719561 [Trichonephila clavipes]
MVPQRKNPEEINQGSGRPSDRTTTPDPPISKCPDQMVQYTPSILIWCPVLLKPHAAPNRCGGHQSACQNPIEVNTPSREKVSSPQNSTKLAKCMTTVKTRHGGGNTLAVISALSVHETGVRLRPEVHDVTFAQDLPIATASARTLVPGFWSTVYHTPSSNMGVLAVRDYCDLDNTSLHIFPIQTNSSTSISVD